MPLDEPSNFLRDVEHWALKAEDGHTVDAVLSADMLREAKQRALRNVSLGLTQAQVFTVEHWDGNQLLDSNSWNSEAPSS